MGIIDLSKDDKIQIQKWLKNFDAISVRETELCQEISQLTEKNISIVLDPVFLLSKEEWSKYCVPINRRKYILYYNLLPSKEADNLVKELQKKWDCDIVEIAGYGKLQKRGKRYVQTADAFEFISYIKNAKFVVTSSFHGVVFSILFEKQFYVVGMGNKVGRVRSLLQQLGIEERLLAPSSVSFIRKIDYSLVHKNLENKLRESFLFIMHSL